MFISTMWLRHLVSWTHGYATTDAIDWPSTLRHLTLHRHISTVTRQANLMATPTLLGSNLAWSMLAAFTQLKSKALWRRECSSKLSGELITSTGSFSLVEALSSVLLAVSSQALHFSVTRDLHSEELSASTTSSSAVRSPILINVKFFTSLRQTTEEL